MSLWAEALERLATQMSPQIYERWLKGSNALEADETLIVSLSSATAVDWVEGRLRPQIQRVVDGLAGAPIQLHFSVVSDEPELIISESYRDDHSRITKPDRVFVGTQYFRNKWVPLLGGPLAWIIIELRQRCYFNRETGEQRTFCTATYEELARAAGVSKRHAMRLLNPEDPVKKSRVDAFIISRETLKEFSKKHQRVINTTTRWQVMMEDPLTPEDAARLKAS